MSDVPPHVPPWAVNWYTRNLARKRARSSSSSRVSKVHASVSPCSTDDSCPLDFVIARDRPRVLVAHHHQQIPASAGDPLLEEPITVIPSDTDAPRRVVRTFRPRSTNSLIPRPAVVQTHLISPSVSPPSLASRSSRFERRRSLQRASQARSPSRSSAGYFSRYRTQETAVLMPWHHRSDADYSSYYLPVDGSYPRLKSHRLIPIKPVSSMMTGNTMQDIHYLSHFLLHLYSQTKLDKPWLILPSLPSILQRAERTPTLRGTLLVLESAIDDMYRIRAAHRLAPPSRMPIFGMNFEQLPYPNTSFVRRF